MNGLNIEYLNTKNYDNILLIDSMKIDLKKLLNLQNIENVAIYGMGLVGKKLADLFVDRGINVCFGIDQKELAAYGQVPVIAPIQLKEQEEKVDIIFVTPELQYEVIRNLLEKYTDVSIVRLSEFLDEVLLGTMMHDDIMI